MEKKPRPHAELIIAWANGAEIQYRKPGAEDWTDCADPAWVHDYEYRVKPAREYPATQMTQGDFNKAMGIGPASLKHCTLVANAALRHAIDNGQVVTREEFDKVSAELKAAQQAFCRMYGEPYRPGMVIRVKA